MTVWLSAAATRLHAVKSSGFWRHVLAIRDVIVTWHGRDFPFRAVPHRPKSPGKIGRRRVYGQHDKELAVNREHIPATFHLGLPTGKARLEME